MRSHRYACHNGSGDGRASAPRSCMLTRAMTTPDVGAHCGRAASSRGLHGAAKREKNRLAPSFLHSNQVVQKEKLIKLVGFLRLW